jgi:hypothetical protein
MGQQSKAGFVSLGSRCKQARYYGSEKVSSAVGCTLLGPLTEGRDGDMVLSYAQSLNYCTSELSWVWFVRGVGALTKVWVRMKALAIRR